MKILGRVTGPQAGELRWEDDPRQGPALIVRGDTRGELIANMREAAHDLWNSHEVSRARGLVGKLDFEIVDELAPPEQSSSIDPQLVDRARLQVRRTSGEHLCFFCSHEPICAVQSPLRAHPQALIVISGCTQFAHVESK